MNVLKKICDYGFIILLAVFSLGFIGVVIYLLNYNPPP